MACSGIHRFIKNQWLDSKCLFPVAFMNLWWNPFLRWLILNAFKTRNLYLNSSVSEQQLPQKDCTRQCHVLRASITAKKNYKKKKKQPRGKRETLRRRDQPSGPAGRSHPSASPENFMDRISRHSQRPVGVWFVCLCFLQMMSTYCLLSIKAKKCTVSLKKKIRAWSF